MKTIQQIRDFVNEQIAFHESRAEIFKDKERRKNKHLETKSNFEALLRFIEDQVDRLDHCQAQDQKLSQGQFSLVLTPAEVADLPQEQREELSGAGADETEFLILEIIEKRGGVATLDQIIVDLYRKTNEVQKRAGVTSKIYRMVKKGLVFGVPTKKGVYSVREIAEEEAVELFG